MDGTNELLVNFTVPQFCPAQQFVGRRRGVTRDVPRYDDCVLAKDEIIVKGKMSNQHVATIANHAVFTRILSRVCIE